MTDVPKHVLYRGEIRPAPQQNITRDDLNRLARLVAELRERLRRLEATVEEQRHRINNLIRARENIDQRLTKIERILS